MVWGILGALNAEIALIREQMEIEKQENRFGTTFYFGTVHGKSVVLACCGVGKVKIEGVTKYIVPLFTAMVVALFLVTFIPAISLCIPYLCGLVPSLGWTF